MKVLIVDLCFEKNSLFSNEFVRPICNILEKSGVSFSVLHYLDVSLKKLEKYDRIILSGTALKDFKYLEDIDKFLWIKEVEKPVLGICAGFQVICSLFGEKLVDCSEIGLFNIETVKKNKLFSGKFEVYELHNKGLISCNNFDVLAKSSNCIQAVKFKKGEIYGCLFHPEVRNFGVIENFLADLG